MNRNLFAIAFFTIFTIFLMFNAVLMINENFHPFGKPSKSEMDDYIIRNTQSEAGSDNGVTSVVFDYRGFDTLGEATVLFTAVAGVIMVFRRMKK